MYTYTYFKTRTEGAWVPLEVLSRVETGEFPGTRRLSINISFAYRTFLVLCGVRTGDGLVWEVLVIRGFK